MNGKMFLEGYVWYLYPLHKDVGMALISTMYDASRFPLRNWENASLLTNFSPDGVILLTNDPEPPKAPPGFEVVAVNVPDGWGYADERYRIRHLSTEDRGGKFYSVFAGLIRV